MVITFDQNNILIYVLRRTESCVFANFRVNLYTLTILSQLQKPVNILTKKPNSTLCHFRNYDESNDFSHVKIHQATEHAKEMNICTNIRLFIGQSVKINMVFISFYILCDVVHIAYSIVLNFKCQKHVKIMIIVIAISRLIIKKNILLIVSCFGNGAET